MTKEELDKLLTERYGPKPLFLAGEFIGYEQQTPEQVCERLDALEEEGASLALQHVKRVAHRSRIVDYQRLKLGRKPF